MQNTNDFTDQPTPISTGMPSGPTPRRCSPWQWYHAQRKRTQFGLGCGVLLVGLLLCSCVGSIAMAGNAASTFTSSPSETTPLSAVPTRVPTATPTTKPTATAQPKIHPYYGGSIRYFTNWYGQPMDDLWKGGRYDFGVWKKNPDRGLIVDSDGTPGPDANIVWLMAPNQVAWTQQQAQNYCIPFLPPDAKLQKENQSVWIYTSNLIKAR